MDVRDVFFWTSEARRRRLVRRLEAYNASLVPWQKPSDLRSLMDGLEADIEAIDQDADEIEKADKENARLIAEANQMMKDRQARRRAQRAAGIAPPKKRKLKPPRKGRLIR